MLFCCLLLLLFFNLWDKFLSGPKGILSEMYISMEGSCYNENLQLFSNFLRGVQDKDMVCLNACPLVNSTGGNCKLSTEVFPQRNVLKQPVD